VLIADDGRALITDFGFSFLAEPSVSITRSLCHGGTFKWMAPELLDNGVASVHSDMWAFGMTALVCIIFPSSRLNNPIGIGDLIGTLHWAGAFPWHFHCGCYS